MSEGSITDIDPEFGNRAGADEHADRGGSLAQDLRDLADDTKTLIDTEVAFQKARVGYVASGAAPVLGMFALAGMLAFLVLIALTVGLVIALVPILTPWGATAAVAGGLLALALVAALIGKSRLASLKCNITGRDL